ncbi:universal stress protein [Ideonella sp. A 288]|uniref:universal stress protein n=1 Tax=Ideonella sp. A 288 TaxID=1962181 RepID=UPI000B4A7441|nr:universal stress protein [Ideonella sp. A 288]
MLKLLIAVDGSDHARHAVEAAARLATQAEGVEVMLLNVREDSGYHGELPPIDHDSIERSLRVQQEALLESAAAQARVQGLQKVTTMAAVGAIAAEIVRVAAEHKFDMIVMGTRGMTALGGLLLGSAAQRVVHLSSVPVLLTK